MNSVNNTGSEIHENGTTSRLTKLQNECAGCINKFLRSLVAKLSDFIKKISSLVLRIVYFSDWERKKYDMESFQTRLEILLKKKTCLEDIIKYPSQATELLQAFHNIENDEYGSGNHYLESVENINSQDAVIIATQHRFRAGNEKDLEEKKAWAEQAIQPFENMMRTLNFLSNEKFYLQERMIINKRDGKEASEEKDIESWETCNEALLAVKDRAQEHYDRLIKDQSNQLWDWNIPKKDKYIEIFENEKEYIEALKNLMNFQLRNVNRLRNGEPSALNLMAKNIHMNMDRDIWLYQQNSQDLPTTLLKLKIKDIAQDIADTTKAMNTFESEVKKEFKVNKILDTII